jgi:hypothetical protein
MRPPGSLELGIYIQCSVNCSARLQFSAAYLCVENIYQYLAQLCFDYGFPLRANQRLNLGIKCLEQYAEVEMPRFLGVDADALVACLGSLIGFVINLEITLRDSVARFW